MLFNYLQKFTNMKNCLLLLSFFLFSHFLSSQNTTSTDNTRFISVTGSAEIVVQPDEIQLEIILKEYLKKSSKKVKLASIEADFMKVLKKNGIDKSRVEFGDSDYYWYYWWNSRKRNILQKRFYVTLDQSTDFLSLMKDLNTEGVYSLRILNTSNKKLQELRKEVKIEAVKAAKEKAEYMLESIDEKLGPVISIVEVEGNRNFYWRQNQLSNTEITTESSGNEMDNITSIKLRYEVKMKFEID